MELSRTKAGIIIPGGSKLSVKGIYTLKKCTVDTPKAQKMALEIEQVAKLHGWEAYRDALKDFYKLFLSWESAPIHNLVVDDGLEMLARIISGDVTYTGVLNYCTLGDNNTAVSASDTTLGNEVHRKLVTSTTFSGNEAFISTFFNQAEIADTIEEIGHVVDGTGSADSGQQYSRIEAADTVELPVTKSASETLTVDYKSTFANS